MTDVTDEVDEKNWSVITWIDPKCAYVSSLALHLLQFAPHWCLVDAQRVDATLHIAAGFRSRYGSGYTACTWDPLGQFMTYSKPFLSSQ